MRRKISFKVFIKAIKDFILNSICMAIRDAPASARDESPAHTLLAYLMLSITVCRREGWRRLKSRRDEGGQRRGHRIMEEEQSVVVLRVRGEGEPLIASI